MDYEGVICVETTPNVA